MSAAGVRAGQAYVEIGGDPRKLFAALGKINAQIGKMGTSFANVGQKMMAAGVGVAAPFLVSAKAFASVGSALFDMSKRTGVATESLSVLKFAAEQTGTDMASVETAVKKMQKAVFAAGNGSKEASKALAMVGLTASDLAGLTADEQMGRISDGLMAIKDPGARAAVAMQLFGKSGTAILPMLDGGSEGMQQFAAQADRLGLIMDTQTAAKADELGDALDSMAAALKMAFVQVGSALAPALTHLAGLLATAAGSAGFFVRNNQQLIVSAVQGAAAFVAAGAAIYGMGIALKVASVGVALLTSPLFSIVAVLTAAGVAIGTSTGLFGQLADTAKTTMGGIYEAIAAGDLAGAMDILWAGLHAGWLRGVATLMQYVDPWIAGFQNTFTYMGAEIAIIFGSMMSGISQVLNTGKAIIMGVVDNIVNGVMASFDAMVSAVRKSWNWVQSFIVRGYDLAKENEKVDNEMAARRRQRGIDRPGVQGRMAQAAQENAATAKDTQETIDFIRRRADSTAEGRLARNEQLRGERNAAADAAEARLGDMSRGARDRRIFRDQANSVIDEVAKAETMDDLRELAQQFHLLAQTGELTADQQKKYGDAVDAASERINESTVAGAGGTKPPDPDALKRAAQEEAARQSEVAGTFSAAALGGMGLGQSLMQKQIDEQKETNRILKEKLEVGSVDE